MENIFNKVEGFFNSLVSYLDLNTVFIVAISLFIFAMIIVCISTARSYEAKLIKAIDMFNNYFIDNAQINEDNLVQFNNKMKSRKVPKQLRKQWQQFVLYREEKASHYMSFDNCVSIPIKNSTFKRDIKTLNLIAMIIALISVFLNIFSLSYLSDATGMILQKAIVTPAIILLLNYIITIFLDLRHNAIVSDLYQNYQYFEVNIDKATKTLPEYVDYEVLFDKNEIKRGIPILYTYLQKRAEEEQRELERARLKNVEHEKFNFDEAGIESALVLERAMQEAENYIAERKKYMQDIERINNDISQEDLNFREITKEYQRQNQVSKEAFENYKAQLAEATSTIEANYLKKQQQQELDRQRNLERDYDIASDRHKKLIESLQEELTTVEGFIEEARKTLERAMMSEFGTYSSKVYDAANKVAQENQRDKTNALKKNIKDLEEKLVGKEKELSNAYEQNTLLSEELSQYQPDGVQYEDQAQEQPEETYTESESQEQYDDQGYQDEAYDETQDNAQQAEGEQEYYDAQYDDQNYDDQAYDEEQYNEESYDDNYEDQPADEQYEESGDDIASAAATEALNEPKEQPEDDDEGYDPYASYEEESDGDVDVDYGSVTSLVNDEEKNNEGQSQDVNVEKPRKKAGRPRKVIDPNDIRPKRGRGRPKKVKVEVAAVKRGRGRPKKDDSEEPKEVKVDLTKTKKSKRGRPKKVQSTNEKVESKSRRGRPRKIQSEVVEQKRGRGRPKKVDTPKTEIKVEPKLTKRGRPRKVQPEVVEEKRGRGRPKKVDAPKTQVKTELKVERRGRPKKVEQVAAKPTAKSNRGRPRKSTQDIEDFDAYLKKLDEQIAEENAKLEKNKKALEKNARITRRK